MKTSKVKCKKTKLLRKRKAENGSSPWVKVLVNKRSMIRTPEIQIVLLSRRSSLQQAVQEALTHVNVLLVIYEKPEEVRALAKYAKGEQVTVMLIDPLAWQNERDMHAELKWLTPVLPTCIWLVDEGNFSARLRVSRTGSKHVVTVPFHSEELTSAVHEIVFQSNQEPIKILMVDDQQLMLNLQQHSLLKAGFNVKTLVEPTRTLEVLESFDPDVVLLDVYMPDVSGAELAGIIRQNEKYRYLPIVFLSSEEDVGHQVEALQYGGDHFMVKPVISTHLIATVRDRADRFRRFKFTRSRIFHNLTFRSDIKTKTTEYNELNDIQADVDINKSLINKSKQLIMRSERLTGLIDIDPVLAISSLSHEIKNPIHCIMGFAKILMNGKYVSDDGLKYLKHIIGACEHAISIIDCVSSASKNSSEPMMVNDEVIQLSILIDECLEYMQPLADARSIWLCTELDDKVLVLGERTKLKQVMLNLIYNAIKYNRVNGFVKISGKEIKKEIYRVSIEDSGFGLSKTEVEKLFNPFTRIDNAKQLSEGMGLGLYITQILVEWMGGRVGVNSEEDFGSEFWVELRKTSADSRMVEPTISELMAYESSHTTLTHQVEPNAR